MGDTSRLYHYTCDHGRAALQDSGLLQPWSHGVVWLTDLDVPHPLALGLTSYMLRCDRTAHRYRVTDASTCVPWVRYEHRDRSIEIEHTRPLHWWVSPEPVPVVYAPMRMDQLLTDAERRKMRSDLADIATTRRQAEIEHGGTVLP